jgi:hypothetical protein
MTEQTSQVESSKEGYGSKRATLPTMMMMIKAFIFLSVIKIHNMFVNTGV